MRRWLPMLLGLIALAVLISVAQVVGLFPWALERVEQLGPWAPAAFVVLYALSVVAMIPSIVPSVAAGALFGVSWGLPASVLGGALGAVMAFGIGRSLAGRRLERRLQRDVRLMALARLASERGWRIVALARLTPVFPFVVANFLFGATTIRARDYFLASLVGTLPSNAVYVYLGAAAGRVSAVVGGSAETSNAERALFVLGLVATIGLAVYLRRLASEALSVRS
jgi:uncharacterized membrane protein YdjX (TVP38/TMEM64 family)